MIKNKKKLKERYKKAKEAKVGEEIVCPSCGTKFIKKHYQQAFCKTKGKTKCKDNYWNNIIPDKRNNKTRISPASAAWMSSQEVSRKRYTSEGYEIINGTAYDEFGNPVYDVDPYLNDHPFSSESLGQWND